MNTDLLNTDAYLGEFELSLVTECKICMETISVNGRLSCGHFFCFLCIKEWSLVFLIINFIRLKIHALYVDANSITFFVRTMIFWLKQLLFEKKLIY